MKKILVFLLAIVSLFTIYLSANTQEVEAVTYDSYFKGVENLTGDDLLEKLAEITLYKLNNRDDGKGKYTPSYDALKTQLPITDADPTNTNNMILFYSRAVVPAVYDSSIWNREHVWAKYLAGNQYGNNNAGADVHHIRPTYISVNSKRSSQKFSEFGDSRKSLEYTYNGYLSGYQNGTYWEPIDEVKGDTARILMYMIMHYDKELDANKSFSLAINIDITDVAYASGGETGVWNMLLRWNKEDPVDAWEARRNEECKKITGFYNPFINYPEFADAIWGNGEAVNPDNPVTPTPTTYSVTYVANGATFDYTDSTKYESGSKVNQPNLTPTLAGHVFEGWYKDSNYTTKWDFTSDTITSNLTLYANFAKVEPQSFNDVFKSLSIKSQLTFNVNEVDGGNVAVAGVETVSEFLKDGNSMGAKDHNLREFMTFNEELFDIQYKHNSSSLSHVGSGFVRFYSTSDYNGSSFDITAKGDIVIKKVTYTTKSGTLKVSISNDGKTAKIQNCGAQNKIDLTSFVIEYETISSGTTYKLEDGSLRLNYALQLTEKEYNLYQTSGKTLELKVNGETTSYSVSKVGNEYRIIYSIKITDNNKVYIPEFSYDGLTVKLAGYSAKTLANYYLNSYSSNELVKKYKSCLNKIVG